MRNLFIKIIKSYQKYISPAIPARCRYIPTCSEYAITAINRFGAFRGGLIAMYRIIRCSPLGSYGYDPVPDHFTFKRQSPKPKHKF